MRHIDLDREDIPVRDFVCSLPMDGGGSVLEIHGKPVARVVPVTRRRVDKAKLKAAILKRRTASRRLNRDWQDVDRQTWSSTARDGE